MLFNSPEFIFGFLPVTLAMFFLLQRWRLQRYQTVLLTIASLLFYGWWSIAYLPLLAISILLNFTLGMALVRRPRKSLLAAAISVDLGMLAYFKYADFGIGTANAVLGVNFALAHVVLPIGISFYTFTQIAFLVDAYQGHVSDTNPGRYALFVSFFPHLIAGPILHHREMTDQFRDFGTRRVTSADFAVGLTIFLIGLFKKVVLADSYSYDVGLAFDEEAYTGTMTATAAWLGTISFALQLYFDFSGYSDMAIGLARGIGIRMPENFNSPYKATSIADFWTRWHMTLSRFLRDYLYIPLGGNRNGFTRGCVNVLITMLLGGLWHGAAWSFVLWGGLHGVYIVIGRLWSRWSVTHDIAMPRALAVLMTFVAVLVAWIPFRAHDFAGAAGILTAMTGVNGVSYPSGIMLKCLVGLAIVWVLPNTQQIMAKNRPVLPTGHHHAEATGGFFTWSLTPRYAVALSFVIAAVIFGANKVSEFIYFRF